MLTGSAPRTGSGWTDSGKPHDERHLKHRARKTTRPVPIPPELVTLLRAHIKDHVPAPEVARRKLHAMVAGTAIVRAELDRAEPDSPRTGDNHG